MVEYSENNRFPFHTKGGGSVVVCTDDNEDLYEMDVIFTQILERFPSLDPKIFYHEI